MCSPRGAGSSRICRARAFRRYPRLADLVGADVWVKHENHQPTAAFKVRGGINLVSQLDAAERERGLITASTGNHGQSIAYAARLFGVPATICVPEGANPLKLAAIRARGANIVVHGRDFDAAREECERIANRDGLRYIHSGNEPHLIAGVGTGDARDARGRAGARRDRRPDRGRQRRRRGVHRRQGDPARDHGHRRPVARRAGRAALVDRAGAAGRPDGDLRRGARDPGSRSSCRSGSCGGTSTTSSSSARTTCVRRRCG